MSNRELIDHFERPTLPATSFHHADHVRLAFAYLREYPAVQALDRFTCALKQFAVATHRPQIYNETITYAYFFLIHERMVRSKSSSWEEFAAANPDLLSWKDGILLRYYQDATLQSGLAKQVFIFPDKCLPDNCLNAENISS
jgi:hypothetical protein